MLAFDLRRRLELQVLDLGNDLFGLFGFNVIDDLEKLLAVAAAAVLDPLLVEGV